MANFGDPLFVGGVAVVLDDDSRLDSGGIDTANSVILQQWTTNSGTQTHQVMVERPSTTDVYLSYYRNGVRKSYVRLYADGTSDAVSLLSSSGHKVAIDSDGALSMTAASVTGSAIALIRAHTHVDGDIPSTIARDSEVTAAIAAITPASIGAAANTDVRLRDDESLQDFIGAMFTGNDETGGALTYDDTSGKIDFVGGSGGKYETTIGNGSATSFDIDHNLGTRGVVTSVYAAADPWDEVDVIITKPTTNRVVITFEGYVPASNEFAVVVIG